MGRVAKKLKFSGVHDKFKDGEYYTIVEYAEGSDFHVKHLYNRFFNQDEVTPDMLIKSEAGRKLSKNCSLFNRLTTNTMRTSDSWIRRSL
jgi:hypothetical protein